MIHNRAVGSQYFAKLDAYHLYVLLFAIVYGQQQAIFSALLATAGYCFRQMYNQSGLEAVSYTHLPSTAPMSKPCAARERYWKNFNTSRQEVPRF